MSETSEDGADRQGASPAPFRLDTRRTPWYVVARLVVAAVSGIWFRPMITGRAHVPVKGPVILAPVHRSFSDFSFTGFLTYRKIFFMAKEELWKSGPFGKLLSSLGVFPVHREGVDREALRRAQEILERGQVLVMFPEGTRQAGPTIGSLQEGAVFLAARTGAPIVPIGIGGSDVSMPKGRRIPRPLRIRVVVGEPVAPPARSEGGRVSRSTVHAKTVELQEAIQAVYDTARRDFERP